MTDLGDPTDTAPVSAGWRDKPGGDELWRLILEAFARAAK